jgi:DNA-binding IclR family transcriptional regulator
MVARNLFMIVNETMVYQAPSVKKAFNMIALLSESDRGLGISELARRLGMSKGTVHGITAALEELGVVVRNPISKRYTIGYTMVELARKGLPGMPLRHVARRHIEALMQSTGQTVFLGIRKEDYILILDVVESNKALKITAPSGTKIPLSAGATGKLFLAYMDEKYALRYLTSHGIPAYTANTVTDVRNYLQEIKEIRKKGFATDNEEYLQGVKAVAALIKSEEPILAALWVVGFSSSITDEKMPSIRESALAAANAISLDLGHIP